MSEQDKCPECGAGFLQSCPLSRTYTCNTWVHPETGSVHQSWSCKINILNQQLAAVTARAEKAEAIAAGLPSELNAAHSLLKLQNDELAELRADAAADARLLEVQREAAETLGVRYDGDQEFVLTVTKELLELRAVVERVRNLLKMLRKEADNTDSEIDYAHFVKQYLDEELSEAAKKGA
jgi:hypothetical protein